MRETPLDIHEAERKAKEMMERAAIMREFRGMEMRLHSAFVLLRAAIVRLNKVSNPNVKDGLDGCQPTIFSKEEVGFASESVRLKMDGNEEDGSLSCLAYRHVKEEVPLIQVAKAVPPIISVKQENPKGDQA